MSSKSEGRMAINYGQLEKQKNGKEKKGERSETNPKLEPKSKPQSIYFSCFSFNFSLSHSRPISPAEPDTLWAVAFAPASIASYGPPLGDGGCLRYNTLNYLRGFSHHSVSSSPLWAVSWNSVALCSHPIWISAKYYISEVVTNPPSLCQLIVSYNKKQSFASASDT